VHLVGFHYKNKTRALCNFKWNDFFRLFDPAGLWYFCFLYVYVEPLVIQSNCEKRCIIKADELWGPLPDL